MANNPKITPIRQPDDSPHQKSEDWNERVDRAASEPRVLTPKSTRK
jgi:hypothetical protein